MFQETIKRDPSEALIEAEEKDPSVEIDMLIAIEKAETEQIWQEIETMEKVQQTEERMTELE